MKRYSKTVVDGRYSEMTNDDNGEWVRYEDAKAVVDALEKLLNNYRQNNRKGLGIGPIMKAQSALNKIKGE